MIRNRRGDEMVEAAMVLPLLILTILSLIMLMLYYYDTLTDQIYIHGELIGNAAVSARIFERIELPQSTFFEMDGIVGLVMRREAVHSIYAVDHGDLLRAGELTGLD